MIFRPTEKLSLGLLMAAILLAVTGSMLNFWHLGKAGYHSDPPARVAAYARAMNEEGSWLVPNLGGGPRLDVPPLYLWAVKLFSGYSIELSPFQARLPGAIGCFMIMVLVAGWFWLHATRYARDDGADPPAEGFGLLAGLILASSPIVVILSREGTPGALLGLIYVAASFCWAESLEARRSFYSGMSWRAWVMWGYALTGLGMLTSGPAILVLLLPAYWFATHSYRLRRPDWIHLPGLALALAFGCWWPLAAGMAHPNLAHELWSQWWSLRLGSAAERHYTILGFLWRAAVGTFPWNLPAAVMVFRVWLHKDRSPTLVFWMASLVTSVPLLALMTPLTGVHMIPLVAPMALLVADCLFRQNFENPWAVAWRTILRLALVLGIAVGIFVGVLINSWLGVTMFIVSALAWLAWTWSARSHGVQYSPWETTNRLHAMLLLLFIATEAMVLSAWGPRQRFQDDTCNYFLRVKNRLDRNEATTWMLGDNVPGLYLYNLDSQPALASDFGSVRPAAGIKNYLFVRGMAPTSLAQAPVRTVTRNFFGGTSRPADTMFEVLTPEAAAATTETFSLAVLGNAGTRSKEQREVGNRLAKIADKKDIYNVLLIGNNLYGPSLWDHLDFIRGFENPYRRLLTRGVLFHAALGHEDQSYAWLQTNYPPFHMFGQRYYSQTFGDGMAEVFFLDSEPLRKADAGQEQIQWLSQALSGSKASWKVVALNGGLFSAASKARLDQTLGERLLPVLEAGKADVVLSAGGQWYERLVPPSRHAVYFNVGWSGDTLNTSFEPGKDGHAAGYEKRPGFVTLTFSRKAVQFSAINDKRAVVDRGAIEHKPAAP